MDNLPFNVFDFIILAVVVAGVLRGRKHGMSEELLGLLMWLAILVVCALAYEPLGQFLTQTSPFGLLASYIMAYLTAGLIILMIFAGVKRVFGGKLLGSDIFGKAEYYLGMASGLVRFVCILLVALALLNARLFNRIDLASKLP